MYASRSRLRNMHPKYSSTRNDEGGKEMRGKNQVGLSRKQISERVSLKVDKSKSRWRKERESVWTQGPGQSMSKELKVVPRRELETKPTEFHGTGWLG